MNKGEQHIHAEGSLSIGSIDLIGRSSKGNERDFNLLAAELQKVVDTFLNGRFFTWGDIEISVDTEQKGCC